MAGDGRGDRRFRQDDELDAEARRLLIYGSGTLVDELTRHGLIDEYRLMVHPVLIGAGKKLFESLDETMSLRLDDVRTTDTGVAVLTYTSG